MQTSLTHLNLEIANLAEMVEKLAPEQIDTLPFGVIRLNREFKVTLFSDTERRQSGYRKEALDRSFFSEIAPCFDNEKYRGRIDSAMAAGRLDMSFDFVADLPSGAHDVDMHLRVQSASDGGCWIFTRLEN